MHKIYNILDFFKTEVDLCKIQSHMSMIHVVIGFNCVEYSNKYKVCIQPLKCIPIPNGQFVM